MTKTSTTSHETFIQRVRDLVLADAELSAEQAAQLAHTKLVYGVGNGSYRGVTCYKAWTNGVGQVDVIEIAATGEESWVQLAGTTIHELAHVLGGHEAGHGTDWKDLAKLLGFTKRPEAAGQRYSLALIRPRLRHAIAELAAELADGSPAFLLAPTFVVRVPRPCSQGHGTRGGTSRKPGTGNRQVKATCGCGRIVRIARSTLEIAPITCGACGTEFKAEQ